MQKVQLLIITIMLIVPLCVNAQEEQNTVNFLKQTVEENHQKADNIYQQYVQENVKSTVNYYDDGFMSYMMYPFLIGRYGGYGRTYNWNHRNYSDTYNYKGHLSNKVYRKRDFSFYNNGGTYYGPDFWNYNSYDGKNIYDSSATTYVPESEYSFMFKETD